MAFDLDKFCELLNSSDRDAALALKVAVAAIPVSLPVLPFLYAKYRSSSNHAFRSWTFASIGRFEELAIPFILTLLESQDDIARCDAIDLLVDGFRPAVRIAYPYLGSRPSVSPRWGEHCPCVLRMLNNTLTDPVLAVRVRAVIVLDDIGEAPLDIVEILIEGLSSEDSITCYNAACYLGRLEARAANALPFLRQMIEKRIGTDGKVIRPVHAAQIAIRRIERFFVV